MRSWGSNSYGQLGDNTTTSSSAPVPVVGTDGHGLLDHVVSVGAGSLTSYAVCAVSAGSFHDVALRSDGTVVTWGSNSNGQLGDGTSLGSTVPVVVRGAGGTGVLRNVVAVSAGGYSSYAVTSSGTVYAWGQNTDGQLGNNSTADTEFPVQVAGPAGGVLDHVVSIAGGYAHVLALRSDGSVMSWGANDSGQLGNYSSSNSSVPVQVSNLGDIAAIGCGSLSEHSFAVSLTGAVYAWGYNYAGILGDGTTMDRSLPVRVPALGAGSGVVQLAAADENSAALTASGRVYVWGDGASGEIGDGSTVDSLTPAQPYGLPAMGLPSCFCWPRPRSVGRRWWAIR